MDDFNMDFSVSSGSDWVPLVRANGFVGYLGCRLGVTVQARPHYRFFRRNLSRPSVPFDVVNSVSPPTTTTQPDGYRRI